MKFEGFKNKNKAKSKAPNGLLGAGLKLDQLNYCPWIALLSDPTF